MAELKNWAGNLTYSAERVHRPRSIDEVAEIVRGAQHLRALGTRHSFNAVADTPGDLLSLENLCAIGEVDEQRMQVTIEGGVRYGDLGQALQGARRLETLGFALPNLASLPHISVAGGAATATHGSGLGNQSLASSVAAIEFIDATGETRVLDREGDREIFEGAVVAMGMLGPVVRLTLDLLPTFRVAQTVYRDLPFDALEGHFDEIMGSAYNVSLFTHWRTDTIEQVWTKRRVESDGPAPETLFGAKMAVRPLHPIAHMPPDNCTEQMGVPGPWNERLPHFRYEFTPSSGDELQSEYIIARSDAWPAMEALREIRDLIAPVLQISEVRTVAADRFWMSPFYEQDSVCLHFTCIPDWSAVSAVLPEIEAALAPFHPVPHWGKLSTMPGAEIRRRFPNADRFLELVREFDPAGKFRNPFLERIFGAV